jgi:hypothetical protein
MHSPARAPGASALLCLLSLSACHSAPPPADNLWVAKPVVELHRWSVQEQGQQVGWLVLLEIEDPKAPTRYYRVENANRQWLGHATLQGRFSRRVPFRDDEEDMGMWAMPQGLARLFNTDKPLALETVAEPAVPAAASAHKDGKEDGKQGGGNK